MEAGGSVVGFASAATRLFASATSHIKVVKDFFLLHQECLMTGQASVST